MRRGSVSRKKSLPRPWRSSCSPPGVPGSVLVVDDDPSLIESLRAPLTGHDIELFAAVDAPAAIAMLDQRHFCGLVLDLVLEEGSGLDVLQHMTTYKVDVPTVVVTARLPAYVRELLDADRVKLVFPKPVEPRLLAAIVLGMCGIDGKPKDEG
jgi:DNA-binding NtrC family response regulator